MSNTINFVSGLPKHTFFANILKTKQVRVSSKDFDNNFVFLDIEPWIFLKNFLI